ncbi:MULTISPECIES: superinfection immunity protein [unclassified Caballeronia]|uniref:superinfection immunity protein n=1 Tax=unclassified Caballeronia TaxID=2646786 RepID=UPI002866F8A3|nr:MULTISPECIES: superinfection immunity protein [unclassified Caballeronia]MDR5754301.1 superinfection immunity protein [Caballeronia sp. LZ024]MDR5840679.1 superinfection immunity protein [Caballeronia sp. LZ031]
MFGILEAVSYLAALLLYLAPAIVADIRSRDDAFAITIVNVLLGWTIVGWIAAFVWARHPVSERRLARAAKSTRRAIAKMTIDALVARSRRRRVA